jgi:1-acyl-sn-glycerol-3-phosphate acyltransferase
MQPTPTATATAIQKDGKWVRRLMALVADVRMQDSLEVDPDQPTIAAGNHQSLLDVFMAAAFCHSTGVSCRFLVNARYFEQKGVGRWLRRIGCIPLNSETKEQAFVDALASLNNHELIGIMPEGRLSKPEERAPQVGPFRPGVAELAREAGAVVRPITFHQSGLAWPRGKWPKLRLPKNRPVVTMRLGGPVTLDGANDLENAKLIEAAVTELLHELDSELGIERR